MKKAFSFLVVFLISLFGISGTYNLKNYNYEISANQQVLTNEENINDVYLEKGESTSYKIYSPWSSTTSYYDIKVDFDDYAISNGQVTYNFTFTVVNRTSEYFTLKLLEYDANTGKIVDAYYIGETNSIRPSSTWTESIKFSVSLEQTIKIEVNCWHANTGGFSAGAPYIYPIIGDSSPTINSFSVNESKTTTNSVNVSWNISDQNEQITNIEIYDKDNNLKLSQYEKDDLVINDKEISNLNSNTNYNLELRINWKDHTSGYENIMKKSTSTITKVVEPSSIEFSLYQINKNNIILSIKYDDPDNVVDKITIHDENKNMDDIVLSPKDLDNGKYKLNGISSGNYNLKITLHWTSLSEQNSITSSQNVEFAFNKSMSVALISTISIIALLILLLLLILLILYLIKRSKNKQSNKDNYYVEDENYYYEDENNFYYENSQY